jgi:hypothetical protein
MKSNKFVRLGNPTSEAERQATFVLLDDPEQTGGSRFDIRLICDLPTPPVEEALVAEMEPATGR